MTLRRLRRTCGAQKAFSTEMWTSSSLVATTAARFSCNVTNPRHHCHPMPSTTATAAATATTAPATPTTQHPHPSGSMCACRWLQMQKDCKSWRQETCSRPRVAWTQEARLATLMYEAGYQMTSALRRVWWRRASGLCGGGVLLCR